MASAAAAAARASAAPRVRGVTFDLDDTLWCAATVLSRASASFHAFLEARAPRVAAAFPPSQFYALLADFQRELPHKAHDYTFLRKHVLRHCIAQAGGSELVLSLSSEDEATLEAFVDEAFLAFVVPRSEPDFFDGVDTLLQQLHDELQDGTVQPVLGVITNGNCLFDRLPDFFQRHMDFTISAEGVGIAKPASRIFDAAVDCFGLTVGREEIVHVGDNYEADVLGAKRAGLRTVWIDAARTKPDVFHRRDMDAEDAAQFPEADAIVTHVCAVIAVVRKWNQEATQESSSEV